MIPATTFAGRRVAVFGLGRSGRATCRSLLASGAQVFAWDESEASRSTAGADGIALTDLDTADWSTIDTLVLAPGVPLTHPAPHWTVNRARAAGAEIIGDIEIFARERKANAPDAPFIAITGTNGKSTTTALIAHLLSATGRDAQMGGNIGVPILSLEPPRPDRFYVIEMSSYQIDLTPTLHPSVGLMLNVSPDHIDRHGTYENYAAIKARLAASSTAAVVGVDDQTSAAIARDLIANHARVIPVSVRTRLTNGYYVENDRIYSASDGARGVVATLDSEAGSLPALRGLHNVQNIMAAYAALATLGIEAGELSPALETFPGLAHRLEEIGRRGNVVFINDSKATNADSAAVALASFERDIYWICGGRAKQGGIAGLAGFFPRIARAYLIGEAEDAFAAELEGRVDYARCGTLEIAVAAAARDAASDAARHSAKPSGGCPTDRPTDLSGMTQAAEPAVLLAPACASFDQYPSFEARGNHFRDIVTALPGIERRGHTAAGQR